ncbi:MAG: DUF927 domain-containing protein, partial [Candidatus Paceibacterota bacterium]
MERRVKVCSPLYLIAKIRNSYGQGWGLYVAVIAPDRQIHACNLPARSMTKSSGDYLKILLDHGLELGDSGNGLLYDYLKVMPVPRLAQIVNRLGWYKSAYVMPDAVYGDLNGEMIVPQDELLHGSPFQQEGSLQEWQVNVGRFCVGNSRLILGVCAALATPLLHLLNMEGGGFHYFGLSSIGKTTLLLVAGSTCGGGSPRGYLRQWRATDNALEIIAAIFNDSLLCLDEIGQASARVVSEVAY